MWARELRSIFVGVFIIFPSFVFVQFKFVGYLERL